ncbi:SufS family cysteine desulfurase [Fructobacillus sp. M1-13]|uniref:Cysteine desulfurase n=1 Tax=Fructobacillus papyriferae TaxID=2713171 RepID=A0ABS5QPG4_9LACO|nr:SufS family cysteine desulfurase [Fructobacillus papyriferae]MBS9335065.1 SufS family cysteine desulfurase [Fructobacillus papyriferae]MCD2159449.1 SufS family cysteine desulfurase [Fructobacillus papyriferae]
MNRQDDFAMLQRQENGAPLAYLDSASTSQKPTVVLEAMRAFYQKSNANVHRGNYQLAEEATEAYEGARKTIADALKVPSSTIIFTKSTTDGLNLVAQSFALSEVQPGDEILLTVAEHHANLLPWQRVAQQKGARLRFVDLNANGEIDWAAFEKKLNQKTKLVAFAHVSNVLGSVAPVKALTRLAHAYGATVVVDGAQAIGHFPVDLKDLDVDFYAFSGHKALGPTGIGVLYGKSALLEEMAPVQLGGEMIETVTKTSATFAKSPFKFEAGTPNIAGAIGLARAMTYLEEIGLSQIEKEEQGLLSYALKELAKLPEIVIYGPLSAARRSGLIAFNVRGVHPHDVGTILDMDGLTLRAGQHCAQPLMTALGVSSTLRLSFSVYSQKEEIDRLILSLKRVLEVFS